MRVRVIDLAPLKDFITKEDMRAAGEYLIEIQRSRIQSGIGQTGKPMKKLDKEYAAEEKAGNRTRTLTQTGQMLDARDVLYVSKNQVRIGFRRGGHGNLANIHQGRTRFVKPTKDEIARVQEFIKERIHARLDKQLAAARSRIR